ncbi:MAG: nickel-dependent lactate racemase [bacterium]|nr:nickel-dependent lactate racemase [bacterium]
MEIRVPWGKGEQTVELERDRLAGIVHPNRVDTGDEIETLRRALSNPLGAVPFGEFIGAGGNVLVIVNDGTRPTPTAKVLDIIEGDLVGVEPRFLIATGVHRGPTEEELRFIFGRHLERFRDRIHVHDARADAEMVHIGTSKSGTEMWINRLGVEADRLVIIGSVEPHYFGGYTGGRKFFLPGIASYLTIEQNHKFAMDVRARALALEGNPVHEDMVDALSAIAEKPIFSIQTVLDRDRKIYAATAGHIHESFYAATLRAKEVFCVEVPAKADVVVSVAPFPMDVDLYQSQKALHNGALALTEGGVLILVSKCRDGIGHDTFHQLLGSCSTLEDMLARIEEGYVLGYHIAAKMAKIGSWAEMWAVTELPDDVVRECAVLKAGSGGRDLQRSSDGLARTPDGEVGRTVKTNEIR